MFNSALVSLEDSENLVTPCLDLHMAPKTTVYNKVQFTQVNRQWQWHDSGHNERSRN